MLDVSKHSKITCDVAYHCKYPLKEEISPDPKTEVLIGRRKVIDNLGAKISEVPTLFSSLERGKFIPHALGRTELPQSGRLDEILGLDRSEYP